MKLTIGLRGTIADDYVKSHYANVHDFLSDLKFRKPLSRVREKNRILFCYTWEQDKELPNAIPFRLEDCN